MGELQTRPYIALALWLNILWTTLLIMQSSLLLRAGPMLQHSRFHGSLPSFAILSLSPCNVQADAECSQIFLVTIWVGREDASSGSVTPKYLFIIYLFIY